MMVAEQRWLFLFLCCCVVSSIFLCFCFFFHFPRCRCCYGRRGGRWQLEVALVMVMLTATGGSSSFLLCFLSPLFFKSSPPCFCPPLLALCFVSPPLPPGFGFSLLQKFSPLNLSFASLILQNFCPFSPIIFPCIYRMSGERVTIPVQVQGMGLCLMFLP